MVLQMVSWCDSSKTYEVVCVLQSNQFMGCSGDKQQPAWCGYWFPHLKLYKGGIYITRWLIGGIL